MYRGYFSNIRQFPNTLNITMNTEVIITTLLTTVVIVFLFIFKKKVWVILTTPFGKIKLHGSNENESNSLAGIRGKNLKAGKDLNGHDRTGRGVDIEKAEAKGSITLTNEVLDGEIHSPK